jgi:hypothetical protein
MRGNKPDLSAQIRSKHGGTTNTHRGSMRAQPKSQAGLTQANTLQPAGLVFAALTDSRRSEYFRSAAPSITAITAAAVFAPHVLWLYQHAYGPFEYAFARHSATSFAVAFGSGLTYLAGSFAYVLLPIVLVLMVARPRPATIMEMA